MSMKGVPHLFAMGTSTQVTGVKNEHVQRSAAGSIQEHLHTVSPSDLMTRPEDSLMGGPFLWMPCSLQSAETGC